MIVAAYNEEEALPNLHERVSAVFAGLVEEGPWPTVAGLVVGGLFAAPFAAYLTKHLKTKTLLVLVGTVISGISAYNLVKALH